MMGLVSIPECIEPGRTYLFYSCNHLFIAECMALSKLMFVLAYPINKHRFSVQVKTSVSIIPFNRPANGTDTKRC